ncbi:hypothetical protein Pmar_PMAR001810 [Perkinsus marinus ATCC 50983]|uniref:Uncharacterized protein n=1 Tax=Perkinsus marinus (strain ATCC 50983 / TXsc) TaxID=423536 RepID=C5LJP8_PERM5|nr:hypothetical protein Pmar_PMAR001810 [Perkinsus marinus ATCC 50983]EER03065.1 hypothetical protein Pmar_PMAR001810 [Perkinsus marinus ATCC 50983]|eukprot:XP_002771249.1 hypothetical protein Pmar_PMAR001810 [Perkinsus marinus ATCC 50983]
MGKKRGVDTPPLAPGTTVLVRVAQRNKLDVGVRIGHIVDVINPSHDGYVRRYKRNVEGNFLVL